MSFSFWKVVILVVLATAGALVLILAVFTDTFGDDASSPVSTGAASNAARTSTGDAPSTSSSSSRTTPTNTPHTTTDANAAATATATTTSPTDTPTTRGPTFDPSKQESIETEPTADPSPPVYTQRGSYRLLDQFPHDTQAYCQGLEVKNATHLYESIGLYKESAMRIVETRTGMVTRQTPMADAYFGEGVTWIDPPGDGQAYLLQLTWQERTAFTYHPETLQQLSNFSYRTTNTQGWGIAFDVNQKDRHIVYVTDGTQFVHTWQMSQGSEGNETSTTSTSTATTTWSYQEIARVPVTFYFPEMEAPSILRHINELEYDPSSRTLLANVYGQNALIRIDIDTGFVTKVYDLSSLYIDRTPEADVFNGIAIIPNEPGRLYVTGKLWPFLYYIELVE